MARRARCSSQRGLLLVEAVLSAVIIGVGLVFITRGLSGQLKALGTVREYETLRALAHARLIELEAARLSHPATGGVSHPPPQTAESDGAFLEPYAAFRWQMAASPRRGLADPVDRDGNPLTHDVMCTVRRHDGSRLTVTVSAVWPAAWVSNEWL